MLTILTFFQSAPAGFDLPLVTALTAFIALPVKVLVDVVKGAMPKLPSNVLPLIGLIIGFVFSMVVLLAIRTAFDSAVLAQCGIAAVGAQVGAMAVTSFQSHVNKTEERVDAALAAKQGTSKAEIDAKVFNTGTGDGK
jgi:hypothetical protein